VYTVFAVTATEDEKAAVTHPAVVLEEGEKVTLATAVPALFHKVPDVMEVPAPVKIYK
jgi:hypothetical protein